MEGFLLGCCIALIVYLITANSGKKKLSKAEKTHTMVKEWYLKGREDGYKVAIQVKKDRDKTFYIMGKMDEQIRYKGKQINLEPCTLRPELEPALDFEYVKARTK